MFRYIGSHSARHALRTSMKRTRPGSSGLQLQAQAQAVNRLFQSYDNDRVVIWPLMAREFSSDTHTPSSGHQERELQRLTNQILYAPKTPLGTMTTDQWDDTMLAMLYWFHHESDIDFDELQEDAIASLENVQVTGFVLDVVDRLLHRLFYEHATKSVASRHRHDDLSQWTLAVLAAWLRVGQDFPTAKMPVERAEKLWAKIVQWRKQGLWKQGNLPVQELARLVQAWLELQSPEGTQKAADLLLSIDLDEFVRQGNHAIIPCYHQALKQSGQFAESCGDLSSSLMERMKDLSAKPGWEAVQPNEDATQSRMIDNFWQTGKATENLKVLSSFETQVLQRNMLQRIHEASVDDTASVDDVMERWNAIEAETDPKLTTELIHALYEYYARIGDPRKATSWLLQLDQKSVSSDEKLKQFERLIRLWAESGVPDACWRSEELLPRLEELALQDGSSVDASVYTSIARLFLDSGEARGSSKAQEIVSRAKTSDASLLQFSLDASLEGSNISVESVTQATKQLVQLWDELDETERSDLALDTARAIAKGKLAPMGIDMVRFLVKKAAVPSTAVCECLACAFSETSEPNDAILLMDLFEECGASLSFDCYRSAIMSLDGIRDKHQMHQTKDMLTRLLEKVSQDKLEVAPKEFGEVVSIVFDSLTDVDKREELLNELIHLYESTGKQECKPTDHMFNAVFTPTTEPTDDHVQRAVSLLDKMIALGVEITDTSRFNAFNTAMHLIMESKTETAYKRVLDIHERMGKAGVSEDAYTLHNIVRACGLALEHERGEALNLAMATLGEIRHTDRVATRTYGLIFRVVGQLLPERDFKELDPLVEILFKFCCDDGRFSNNIRKYVQGNIRTKSQGLMSPEKWKECYEQHLDGDKKEPPEWTHRNGDSRQEK